MVGSALSRDNVEAALDLDCSVTVRLQRSVQPLAVRTEAQQNHSNIDLVISFDLRKYSLW